MKLTRRKLKQIILKEMASMRNLNPAEYRAQMLKQTPGLIFGAIADLNDYRFVEYDEYGEEEPNPELRQLHFILQNVDQYSSNVLMQQDSPAAFIENVKNSIPVAISIIENNPEFSMEPDAVILYLQKILNLT